MGLKLGFGGSLVGVRVGSRCSKDGIEVGLCLKLVGFVRDILNQLKVEVEEHWLVYIHKHLRHSQKMALPLMYKNPSVQALVYTKLIRTKTHSYKSHIYNDSSVQCLVYTQLDLTKSCLYKT